MIPPETAIQHLTAGDLGLAFIAEYRGGAAEERSGLTKKGQPYQMKAALHNLEIGPEAVQWAEELPANTVVPSWTAPYPKGTRVFVQIKLLPGTDRGLFRVRITRLEEMGAPTNARASAKAT